MTTPAQLLAQLQQTLQTGQESNPSAYFIEQILLMLSGGVGNATQFVFVYRPGGVAAGNVYTSLPALVTAAAAVQGVKIVQMDNSLGAVAVPAGVFDLGSPTLFIGDPDLGVPIPVTFADQAELRNVVGFYDLGLVSLSSKPVCANVDPASLIWTLGGKTTLVSSGTVPFFSQDVAGPLTLQAKDYASVNAGAVASARTTVAGANLSIVARDGAFWDTGTVAGVLGSTCSGIIASASAFVDPSQPGALGGFAVAIWEQGKYVQYADTAPLLGASQVQAAIDALKALILGGGGGTFMFPNRLDLSVNNARVSSPYSNRPVLQTSTGTNAAGAYNGGGVGNKSILGFKGLSGVPLASIVSIVFDWMPLSITPPAPLLFYANLIVDLGGGAGIRVFVIDTDPAVVGPLNTGVVTSPAPGVLRMTHTPAVNFVQIVNAFGPVPPAIAPVPVPVAAGAPAGPWQASSFSYASILAAYPGATLIDASSGDGGLPKAPTVTPALMLLQGDSSNLQMRASAMVQMLVNGVPF